ncbi:MAG: DUF6498-containing protein [Akkermansiaceae bacterium]
MENQLPISRNFPLLVLIGVNLLPIAGVLLWGWSAFEIVALYWFENVVIGAINVLKMVTCRPRYGAMSGTLTDAGKKAYDDIPDYLKHTPASEGSQQASKLFIIPFFLVHYGMFCFGHGIFVFVLLGGKGGPLSHSTNPFRGMMDMVGELFKSGAVIFVLAIIGSHLFSFLVNYIGKSEYRETTPSKLMGAPYGRIIVLHIAIIFGAFAVMAFGDSTFLLILVIIGKILLDAKLHLRSHQNIDESSFATQA